MRHNMENEKLSTIINNIEEFKADNSAIVKNNINIEISLYRKTLPNEILTEDLDLKIQNEVDKKILEFNNNIDLKPKALYYALKSELELDEQISEKKLTISAYDYLEKNTKNKFLKKILKELIKESK